MTTWPEKNLAPGRHYLDSGYLSAAVVVSALRTWGIALIGPAAGRHLRAGPAPATATPVRPPSPSTTMPPHRHLPARPDRSVLVRPQPRGNDRHRGHLRCRTCGPCPARSLCTTGRRTAADADAPRPGRSPGRRPHRGKKRSPSRPITPAAPRRWHRAPGRQPTAPGAPATAACRRPARPREHGLRAQPAPARGLLTSTPLDRQRTSHLARLELSLAA